MLYLLINLFFLTFTSGQPGEGGGPGEGGEGMGPGGDIGTTSETVYCDELGLSAEYRELLLEESTANGGYVRNVISSGCPNHPWYLVNNFPNPPQPVGYDYKIPAYPCFSDQDPYSVVCVPGSIGLTFGGASIHSLFDGMDCDDDNDAVVSEIETFDNCSGHSSPDGTYHYHIVPACVLDQLGDANETVDGHSPQLGWAKDGFPIYGPHGLNGEYIYLCNHTNANLSDCVDTCNGHSQHEIDGFKYHYHVTGPIGDLHTSPVYPYPDTDMYPYTIGCLMGVPFDWDDIGRDGGNGASCLSNGYTDDYVPQAMEGLPVYGGLTPSPITDVTPEPTSMMDEAGAHPNYYQSINLRILFFLVYVFCFFY